MSQRVCDRCGKPDKEVDMGFVECRACWEITSQEAIESWGGTPENEYIFRSGWKGIDPDYWKQGRP